MRAIAWRIPLSGKPLSRRNLLCLSSRVPAPCPGAFIGLPRSSLNLLYAVTILTKSPSDTSAVVSSFSASRVSSNVVALRNSNTRTLPSERSSWSKLSNNMNSYAGCLASQYTQPLVTTRRDGISERRGYTATRSKGFHSAIVPWTTWNIKVTFVNGAEGTTNTRYSCIHHSLLTSWHKHFPLSPRSSSCCLRMMKF